MKIKSSPVDLNTTDSSFDVSILLNKFAVHLMKNGKKFKAEKLLHNVFVKISLKGHSPTTILTLAVNNVKPLIEMRKVRSKGKSFQVPFPIKTSRQISTAFKTLIKASISKKNFEDSLVEELIQSSKNQSQSVKFTNSIYKLAYKNRLFTRFRWV